MDGMDLRLTPGDSPGRYKVEIDGHDVSKGVSGVEIGAYADPLMSGATLTLGFVRAQVHLPDAKIRIDEESAAVLERLGWTRPKERS
jgi:hypothetical protein